MITIYIMNSRNLGKCYNPTQCKEATMDYKKLIVNMVESIDDEKFLKKIYSFVKVFFDT